MARGKRERPGEGVTTQGAATFGAALPSEGSPTSPETKPALPANALLLAVTPAQLARCIENQMHALTHIIADANSPPIDGGLAKIAAGLEVLQRVVPILPDKEPKS